MTPRKAKPQAATIPASPNKEEESVESTVKGKGKDSFFIVGMGGSAGALEAFEQFFHHLPPDSGMAFVMVPHLDPTHKGIMPELLQRFTTMKVHQVADGMKVRPNTVYVIPPNKDMAILRGVLQLLEPSAPRGLRLPIDFFFRHLAEDQKEKSIGIILSGMGTDGTLGLKAIKEHMGMAMVQEPTSAKYDGMPRSAQDTGLADYIAPAEELPGKLMGYAKYYAKVRSAPLPVEKKTSSALQKVLLLLRARTGNDFSLYKKNTILRRIDRRMSVHQITTMARYVAYLQENAQEIDLLFKELLIGVTNFFRDSEAFEALKTGAILPILKRRNMEGTIRVWVPGCSTGEEAYSIAILLKECMDCNEQSSLKVQIYATDIDLDAITMARQGLYPGNIVADVSPERLQKYFFKEDNHYRIKKDVREMVVFAPQNVIADPPFTKLDLLSCRNLLIYLTPELQKKLLPLFHYTLLPGAFLFLGPSETVSAFNDLFSPLDGKWKIFQRRESVSALTALPEFPVPAITYGGGQPIRGEKHLPGLGASLLEIAQRFILERVTAPVILINEKGDLIYSSRRTGKYLEPSVGRPNLNIFDMAREGLKFELAIAVRKALNSGMDVHVRGLTVVTNGDSQDINLTVMPLKDPEALRGLLMVVLEDIPPEPRRRHRKETAPEQGKNAVITQLEKELQYTREHLQTTIEEMETSQEELKSTNEELQSTNEELQSTNEELTTSKEELQSLNEELMTLNAELQAKNDELSLANNDMRNLLNSTQIPTLFLDNHLRIKRFTTPATKMFSLITSDVGRPITDIASHLHYENLVGDVQEVLDSLVSKELAVETRNGRWCSMRIMPYRTLDNVIDGVVITLNDITELKKAEQLLEEHEHLRVLAAVVNECEDAIAVLDGDGKILAWNSGAERLYGWTEAEALGMNLHDWVPEEKREEWRSLINRLEEGETSASFTTRRLAKSGEVLEVWVSARRLTDKAGAPNLIVTTERVLSRNMPGGGAT